MLPSVLPNAEEHMEIVYKQRWALANGFVQFPSGFPSDQATIVPFTLRPSRFSRKLFNQAVESQAILNLVYYRMANYPSFLLKCLTTVRTQDRFIDRLCKLLESIVASEGWENRVAAPIFRSDYMVDTSRSCQLSQIEFNTISIAFVGLADVIPRLHQSTDMVANENHNVAISDLTNPQSPAFVSKPQVMPNLVNMFCIAWRHVFGDNFHCICLFVVLDNETNVADQIIFEQALKRAMPKLVVRYRSLKDIGLNGVLDKDNKLSIRGESIGFVYLRCGYTDSHYTDETAWKAREMIEKASSCIRCPSLEYQLAGMKRIQAELCTPNVLEKFCTNKEADMLRNLFTDIYALDEDDQVQKAREVVDDGTSVLDMQPCQWLLKPQAEGGTGQIFNTHKDIVSMLGKVESQGYILMKRINPPISTNMIIWPGFKSKRVQRQAVVSEFGIFGGVVSQGDKLINSCTAGYLMRTKPCDELGGGVASGHSALDSVDLYDR